MYLVVNKLLNINAAFSFFDLSFSTLMAAMLLGNGIALLRIQGRCLGREPTIIKMIVKL